MEINNKLIFFVNGKKVIEENVKPEWTLLYYLRNKLNLCGTKLGCGEGGCGACTVMISKYQKNRNNGNVVHLAVNACLAPVCAMHGLAVTTVEGIGSTKTKLHPVQERIAKAHGSQCGFCTPGIVMSMYTLLRNMPKPTVHDLEEAFQGNLCRCTGYRPIIEAYKTFVDGESYDYQNGKGVTSNGTCSMGKNCCKNRDINVDEYDNHLFDKSEFIPYDHTQEPIFPPELKITNVYNEQYLKFESENIVWYRPQTLEQLLELKEKYPQAKLVIGNTEIGIEIKNNSNLHPIIIHASAIIELNTVIHTNTGVQIGAATSLQDLETILRDLIIKLPNSQTKLYKTIVNMLHWFASKQIRNVGSVGGNLMNSSPISDLNPIFASANIILHVICVNTKIKRDIIVNENFFTGYRKNLVKNTEILIAITLPFSTENQFYYAAKQSKRREDDIAIVNMALFLELKSNIVKDIRLFFGGMAPVTVGALNTKQNLIGKIWNDNIIDVAFTSLLNDLPLASNAPGGMIQYRRTLALSLFFKAYMQIINELNGSCENQQDNTTVFNRMSSLQCFTKTKTNDPVGKPVVHRAAFKQATGEAVYCDDIPGTENELYMAHVLSTRTHAKIIAIDYSQIYKIEGVVAFFSEKDLPNDRNKFGTVHQDQDLFARNEVLCYGQIIGIVIGKTKEIAKKAAQLVKVEYDDLPSVITIDEAIVANSYFPGYPKYMERGNPDKVFENVDHVIHKQLRLSGQDQFYLETHCALAIPVKEDDEMVIYSSTQDPMQTSRLVAKILDIPLNRVVTKVKRMGGAFGGKETACFYTSLPCALAAYKLNHPVRCMLDRDEDMLITGGRNPFLFDYKIGFNSHGKIEAINLLIYTNAGHSFDLSGEVLVRAMFHVFNSYKVDNFKINGYLCRTNLPSNTAFRGFGAPQAIYAAEYMIRYIAEYLKKDVLEIMSINLCTENYVMPYGQILENCTLQKCVDECFDFSNFCQRRVDVDQFNKKNKWKKRGIAFLPIMFGVGYDAPFLNQAGALIHVYVDGSVSLFHGGTEMGQGLHTKMIQIASKVLEIPITMIHIAETATDKVPNTISTAASSSSDLNGMAVLNACQVIRNRIEPFKEANPKGKWSDWINSAFMARVSLSATGYYRTPGLQAFNWDDKTARPYNYISYGAGCSEVEIDCLTGNHTVLRTDIVMDLGESLNPAIDIGQIEGAFLQGYGLFTMEELLYSPTGRMLTRGPSNYKIPSFSDIPLQFNVTVLKGQANPRAVYSSKAVGEPPLLTSPSVFFAIREAIKAARHEFGLTNTNFEFNAPATVERIRMACSDHITSKVASFLLKHNTQFERKGNKKLEFNLFIVFLVHFSNILCYIACNF